MSSHISNKYTSKSKKHVLDFIHVSDNHAKMTYILAKRITLRLNTAFCVMFLTLEFCDAELIPRPLRKRKW